jgi:hypothetical protein
MNDGLLTETANYDTPGSWGPASAGWPDITGDVAYAMYVFANCVQSVPYGSYVLIAQRGRYGASQSVLRVHAQHVDKLRSDFEQAGEPDAETSIARRETYGKPNQFGNKEAAPLWRDVRHEVERAMRKFPTWPTDPLHALAVLGEEFGELTKDVLQLTYEPHKTSRENVRTEAIQTAAMALRFAASLDAYEYRRGEQHAQEASALGVAVASSASAAIVERGEVTR